MNQNSDEEAKLNDTINLSPEANELKEEVSLTQAPKTEELITDVEKQDAPKIAADIVLVPDNEKTTVASEQPSAEAVTLAGKEEVILEFKQKKEKGPWGIIFLFIILISFIFFMPQLTPYIKKFIGQGITINGKDKKEDPEKPANPNPKEVFYKLNTKPTIKNADLEISDIVIAPDTKNDYYVEFKIKNISEKSFDFSKKYYLQLYNDVPTLLSRAKVYNSIYLTSGDSTTLKLRVKAESATTTQVSLVALTAKDYPVFTLNHDDSGNQKMTCSFHNQKYIYNFLDYKLKTINITNSVSSTEFTVPTEYQVVRDKAALEVAKWNNIDGISAIYSNLADSYTTTADFDLKSIDATALADLKMYELFALDAEAKVVGFEMGTMGYTCQKDES